MIEISEPQVNQCRPHRRHVALRCALPELTQKRLRPVHVPRLPVRVAEHADVVRRAAAQLDGPLELGNGPLVLAPLRAGITERVVGKGECRLERQRPLELLDGPVEVMYEIVDVADLGLHLEVEGVQALGLRELDESLIVPRLEQREPPGVP